jgi:hypothetical protein
MPRKSSQGRLGHHDYLDPQPHGQDERPLWWRLGMKPLWWHRHPARLRRMYRGAGILIFGAIVGVMLSILLTTLSPWPPLLTLKHFAAFPSCKFAQAVGLAPAHKGEPGYWSAHDDDGDGEACELWVKDGRGWHRAY